MKVDSRNTRQEARPAASPSSLTVLLLLFVACTSLPASAVCQVSIVGIGVFDDQKPDGEISPNVSIDMVRDVCKNGDSGSPEPFFDTYVGITLRNQGSASARLSRLSYEIPRAHGARTYRSPSIAFSGSLEVPPGETVTAYAPIFIQRGDEKQLPNSRISGRLIAGLKTVHVRIQGTSASRAFSLRGATTLSFGNFDRCD